MTIKPIQTLCRSALLGALLTSSMAYAAPSMVDYAKCSGILVVAADMSNDAPSRKKTYMSDADALEKKASKLPGYNKGTYNEISFDSSGNYVRMIKSGQARAGDLWADASYCRGMAQ